MCSFKLKVKIINTIDLCHACTLGLNIVLCENIVSLKNYLQCH